MERDANEVRDDVVAAYKETRRLNHVVRATGVGYDLTRGVLFEEGIPDRRQPGKTHQNRNARSAQRAERALKAASKALGGKVTIQGYRELVREGPMANGQSWPKSAQAIMRALGTRTWNEALVKVGLLVIRPGSQRTTAVEPGLRVIRDLTQHLGRPPKIREYDEVAVDRGVVRSQTLTVHFGRWWDVLEAAGVELDERIG